MRLRKSYYLGASLVKKLSGYTYYRLSIYHKRRLVTVIGFLDLRTNILFVDFERFLYYTFKGLEVIRCKGLLGTYLREVEIGAVLTMGLYQWLFSSKVSNMRLKLPLKFWKLFLNYVLKIIYYLVFRNLISWSESGACELKANIILARILIKRTLVIKRLGLFNK